MVQQPLEPRVLEAARQLLDRTTLRWPDALQLGSALSARNMFPGTEIIFVSASPVLLEAAKTEGLETVDPAKLQELEPEPVREPEAVPQPEYAAAGVPRSSEHPRRAPSV